MNKMILEMQAIKPFEVSREDPAEALTNSLIKARSASPPRRINNTLISFDPVLMSRKYDPTFAMSSHNCWNLPKLV